MTRILEVVESYGPWIMELYTYLLSCQKRVVITGPLMVHPLCDQGWCPCASIITLDQIRLKDRPRTSTETHMEATLTTEPNADGCSGVGVSMAPGLTMPI